MMTGDAYSYGIYTHFFCNYGSVVVLFTDLYFRGLMRLSSPSPFFTNVVLLK